MELSNKYLLYQKKKISADSQKLMIFSEKSQTSALTSFLSMQVSVIFLYRVC